MDPMLEFDAISKSFQGVQALKDVCFSVRRGAVLGLIGENGAGKSTLMNILGGIVRPDAGRMRLAGAPYAPAGPRDAERAGIAFIHQELNLFPNLSIKDNLFISGFPRVGRLPWISRRRMRERARTLLEAVELEISTDTPVERLAPGERQLVEIAKALRADARIIIFDEPTTSLTTRETARLFRLIGSLRAGGAAIIFISHTLSDVLALSDEVAVLRDGELVAAGPVSDFTVDRMIDAMVGRSLQQLFPTRTAAPLPEAALEAWGVSQPGVVHEVSFSVRKGEVLGLFGLMGSGRTELARILFGLDTMQRGEILLDGVPVQDLDTSGRIARGLGFVTESRRDEGLLMESSIAENVGLASLPRFSRRPFGFVEQDRLHAAVGDVARALRLKSRSLTDQPVKHLSGGNQQKAVLGKWLLTSLKVLILDEPTRGIDVGAKYEVYSLVADLAAQGVGILCISSELEELIGLCDRILVMSHGEISGVFERDAFDQDRLLRAAFGEAQAVPTV